MNIRRAQPAEADRLTAIALAAKGHWGYSDELMAQWRPSLTVTLQRIVEDGVYVATLAAQIIGFYGIMPTEDVQTYELDDLWIEPVWIGQGTGQSAWGNPFATGRRSPCHRLLYQDGHD